MRRAPKTKEFLAAMSEPPTFTYAEEVRAREEFYRAFGAAMAAWARLESCLFYWFIEALKLEEATGRAIYFSAKSFGARREIFNAAIPHSTLPDEERDFLRAFSKKAAQYAEFRNRVAHGEPMFVMRSGSSLLKQYGLAEPRLSALRPVAVEQLEKEIVSVAQLNTATANFDELRRLAWDMHPAYRESSASPVAYRVQVLALPNQAYSTEPAQTTP
jgi:hypothetical protein